MGALTAVFGVTVRFSKPRS